MDPLSITASVITVLEAAGKVISICYNYRASTKKTSWELPKVIEEVKSLRDVLEAVEQLAVKAESADGGTTQLPTLKQHCGRKGPLAGCLEELGALEKKLSPPSWSGPAGSTRRGLIEALGWPLKEGETKKTLENIGRFKATLNIALTVDQGALALETHFTTGQVLESSQAVQSELTLIKSDNLYEKILQWLAAPDPSLNHNAARNRHQATTGSWFIESEQFTDWRKNSDTFLWLHGIPGCGKTILSSTIIEDVASHCDHDTNLAVVYFYFDFNDSEKQETEKMIRSLLSQLGRQRSTAQSIRSLYSGCKDGGRSPTCNELLAALQGMVRDFDGVFIVLDALDECKEREKLLKSILELAGWRIGKLHTLVTSRRERDIEDMLDSLVSEDQKLYIQSNLIDKDIRTYVHEKLRTDRGMRRWQKQPKVQMEIEMTLTEKADGMFRWAACQLDALGKCLDLKTLRKALASLPETLDETYSQILNNIYSDHRESAFRILQWLAYSARPLQLEEVVDVLAVDVEGDPRFDIDRRFAEPLDVLTICSSLVTVVEKDIRNPLEEPESPYNEVSSITVKMVRLAHFSVKEYLVSDRIRVGSAARYSIREIPANRSMAEVCLAYLLQFDKPYLDEEMIKDYPLASYAARFWMQHARVLEEDVGALKSVIMELLQYNRNAFTNSIRLFDPHPLRFFDPENQSHAMTSDSVGPAIYYTARAGSLGLTRLLLEVETNVNAQTKLKETALHAASVMGHDQIVQLLLEAGADVNAQNNAGLTALMQAAVAQQGWIVKLLLEAGADVNAQNKSKQTALMYAAVAQQGRIVQLLLEAGADVDTQGQYECTAPTEAAGHEYYQVIPLLVGEGADVNAQDEDGHTALIRAALYGYDKIVEQLLEAGADVKVVDKYGCTPLVGAAIRGDSEIVQRLLEAGADMDAQDEAGHTAVTNAALELHPGVVQQLLEAGANVKAEDLLLIGQDFIYNLEEPEVKAEHDRVLQQLQEALASKEEKRRRSKSIE